MNTSRINGREQGRETCDESKEMRRRGKDPDFDRALASASCGPQDSSATSAAAGKVAPGSASGQTNACAPAEIIGNLTGQSTGAIRIPELMAHPAQEEASKPDRSTSRTRLDSASTTTAGAEQRAPDQGEIARTDPESQELPSQIRRLLTEARIQSASGESSKLEADPSGPKAEPSAPQSWVNSPWNEGVSGRQLDTRGAASTPQRGSASNPEQAGAQLGAGSGRSNQVTVHFDGEGGLDGRLRVAVRGQSVQATIISEDHAMAVRLGRNIDELHHALRGRGFLETDVSIQKTQQETPLDRLAQDTGARREDESRQDREMQRDRSRSDSEDQPAGRGQEHRESER